MPIVRMPDGANVQFPDDMPPDQIRSLIAQKFPQVAGGPSAASAPTQPITSSQVNRSAMADPLNPSDVDSRIHLAYAKAPASGMTDQLVPFADEAGAAGMAVADTVSQLIKGGDTDISGAYNSAVQMERKRQGDYASENPVKSIAANIVGGAAAMPAAGAGVAAGALPLIRQGVTQGAIQGGISGAGDAEGGLENRAIGAGLGAGIGAAAGGVLSGIGGAALTGKQWLANLFAGKSAPSIDDLKDAASQAYKAVDNSGFVFDPKDYDTFVTDLVADLQKSRLNPMRHPKAASVMEEISGLRGKPQTLTEMDQLRQVVRRDLSSQPDESERMFGEKIIDKIDDLIDTKASSVTEMKQARQLHHMRRKAESIEEAVQRARLNADSSGVGGNIDNALRQQMKRLITNPKLSRRFSKDEKDEIYKIVKGSNPQKLARFIGRLAPNTGSLQLMANLGAASVNPLALAGTAAASGAKHLADTARMRAIDSFSASIRSGRPPVGAQSLTPRQRAILQALISGSSQSIPAALE